MVILTEKEIRKRAEHHDGVLSDLEEVRVVASWLPQGACNTQGEPIAMQWAQTYADPPLRARGYGGC